MDLIFIFLAVLDFLTGTNIATFLNFDNFKDFGDWIDYDRSRPNSLKIINIIQIEQNYCGWL